MYVTRISTQVGQSVKSACVLTINCLKMVKIKLQWVFALLKMCCNSASSYCNRYIRNISKNVDFFFLLSCLLADFHLMRDTFQKKNRCELKKVSTQTLPKFFFRQQLLGTSKRFSSSRLFSMGNASVECSLKIFTYVRVCAYKVLLLRYVRCQYLYAHTQVQAAICHEIAGGLNPLPAAALSIYCYVG